MKVRMESELPLHVSAVLSRGQPSMSRFQRIGRSLRRTLLQAIPTILGIIILNFFLLQLAPGDAADVMAGEAGSATEETMAALRARFGLDNPVLVQLVNYLNNLAHFSLGFSPRY